MKIRIFLLLFLFLRVLSAQAHIIPPEQFHPVAESYRRLNFMLNLNPILWKDVKKDIETIADQMISKDVQMAEKYKNFVHEWINPFTAPASMEQDPPGPEERKKTARMIFEESTKAVTRILVSRLESAEENLTNYPKAYQALNESRQIWASFEHEVKATDPEGFRTIGLAWLELTNSLGNPGLFQVGVIEPDKTVFKEKAQTIKDYVLKNFGENFRAAKKRKLAPLPQNSPTYDKEAEIPVKLPPGHNINKQIPRPRQILNMAARGVNESETPLIALGDMAFDSAHIFGDPALALQITCNTCHNKGVTNPQFFIPGLSKNPGSVDVSSNFFAPHANNGHFDPVDIPDLRGIRFTAPYGRNGRFTSLRDFTHNGIKHEFNGLEPDPLLLDALIAYMNEFDFLPNPYLNNDGTLNDQASESAKNGEKIFHTPFEQMGMKSCATCHVPSDHFLDRKRHDIGTVMGSEANSLDRALDTPTLLSSKFTPPYFHDGSQPTLRDVNLWFNQKYNLGLNERELNDLTAYLETVGDGIESYEGSPYYLDAEMEEFDFFLSTYEYLKRKDKRELMDMTFKTIASEIRNHKWELRDMQFIPIMDDLALLMDEAYVANQEGDYDLVDDKVSEYRKLYAENVDFLK